MNCWYCKTKNEERETHCNCCRRRLTRDKSGCHVPLPVIAQASGPIAQPTVRVGHTCLRVIRLEVNERTGKETHVIADEGIVVQNFGDHVRVFNPAPIDKGGDLCPETAEVVPLVSKRIWCEFMSERKHAYPIPPALR